MPPCVQSKHKVTVQFVLARQSQSCYPQRQVLKHDVQSPNCIFAGFMCVCLSLCLFNRLPGSAKLERSDSKAAIAVAAANGPSGAFKVALGHCGIHWVRPMLLIVNL